MRPGQRLVQGGTGMRAPSLCAGTAGTLGSLTPGPSIPRTEAQAQGPKCWQEGKIKRLPSKLDLLPSGSRGVGRGRGQVGLAEFPKSPGRGECIGCPSHPFGVPRDMSYRPCWDLGTGLSPCHTWTHNLQPEERGGRQITRAPRSSQGERTGRQATSPAKQQQGNLQQILGGAVPRPGDSSPGS